MTEHTPAPWRADCKEGVWTISARDARDTVAFFCCYGRGQGHPALIAEAAVNARLIAAAPDLLAALEVIANSTWPSACPPDWCDMIRAAIAKARP